MLATSPKPEEAARELLEVVPVVMKEIRHEMRNRRSPDLTVPQFRTLAFLDRNKGSSLSALANHMGLTLPSTSRLVDILIDRRLLTREDNPADRRCVELTVTNLGIKILEASRKGALDYLANKLSGISSDERKVIVESMKAIRSIFMDEPEIHSVVK